MALPSLVNTYSLSPGPASTSAETAGMVPTPAKKLYVDMASISAAGIAEIDANTNTYTAPPGINVNGVGGICFDGTNVFTGQSDGGIPQTMDFTEWNATTLLPTASTPISASTGNGKSSGDCVSWAGSIWQLANTSGVGPVAQLVSIAGGSEPMVPATAPPGFNGYNVSRMIVAGGHLYYFQMISTVAGGPVTSLVVDGVSFIATSLPSANSGLYPAVDGIAFDGVDLWVTLPTQNAIAKVSTAGAVLSIVTTNVPQGPTAIAVDFMGNIWVGNSNPFGAAIPISLVVFDSTATMLTSFSYPMTNNGIANIVADSFSSSIWVAYSRGVFGFAVDQYQFLAPAATGKWHGTFVGFGGSGQAIGGNN